jgi:hypothetical protein
VTDHARESERAATKIGYRSGLFQLKWGFAR